MALWWKRYEPLLEAKTVSGASALTDLIAREVVELWEAFPPAEHEVAWEDPTLEARLAGRLGELPRLDPAFVDLVAQLVTWDLEHEMDAIDHLLRNDRHRAAAPTAAHVEAMHLLWRALVEHLYQRKDDADGILKRAHLVEIVEKARVRFRARRIAMQ